MEYKVEKISQFKGETLRIDFDVREPLFINSSIVYDRGIRVGTVMTDEDIEAAIAGNDYRRARERALYLLDERDYSYVEMFKKLESNYSEEICYKVVDNLAELGLINDRRYAKKCAEYFMTRKLWGKYRAREEMKRRGLTNDLIGEALSEYEEGSLERLTELISKKYLRKLSEENGRNKVKAALARQGFSYDEINAALAEFEEE